MATGQLRIRIDLGRAPAVLELKREIATARKAAIKCRALLYFQQERQRIERELAPRPLLGLW